MPNRVIRPATPAHYETFAKLFRELAVEEPVPSFDAFCTDLMPTVLVAEVDETPRAYAFFRPIKDAVHLSHLVTAPEARREGHAHALVLEVARQARAAGCTQMTLNVRADNTPAIRLYERLGFRPTHSNYGLKIPWASVAARAGDVGALVARARDVASAEDGDLEAALRLPRGILAEQRARPGRTLRTITSSGKTGLVVLNATVPVASPFRAQDLDTALALLLAVRPFSRPEQDVVHLMVEDDAPLVTALVDAGATLKMVATFLRGPLPA